MQVRHTMKRAQPRQYRVILIMLPEQAATHDSLRGTFEHLVADVPEKSCTPPPVPIISKKI